MSLHIDPNLVTHGDHELSLLFRREQARQQAMLEGDVTTLSSLLHPDAMYIHSSGMVDNKRTYMEPLRMGDVTYQAIGVTVEHIRYLTSTVNLLSGRAKMQTIQFAKNNPLDNLFIMTWVRHSDGWKMSSWQSTPVNVS
jgi:hypothetical protein